VIQEVTDVIKPGVLLMFSCFPSYLAWLTVNHPALSSRINRSLALAGFSDEEASLLIAKKLLVKRLVEDLDPIYPFDKEAIHLLNQAARANPRALLELADLAVEYGASHRSYRVDGEVVRAVLAHRTATTPRAAAPTKRAPPEPSAGVEPVPPPTARPAPAVPNPSGDAKMNWAES
jgi:hypothetical protein